MAPYWVINGVVTKFQLTMGLLSPRLRSLMTIPWIGKVGLIYIAVEVATILSLGL